MTKVRQIERGGYGVVDEVAMPDGTHLARKTFDPPSSRPDELEKLRRRFEREVRIQSRLSHPNIMPIVGYDLASDPPWFTMPLASGSYADKIQSDRAAGTADPKPWTDILAAVEELHRLGFVHRDLKPANVLFLDSRWVVSDFGLILPTMRDTTVLTGTGSAYGTRSYAAPEQASDFRHTPEEADIYALGCILHDLVSPKMVRVPFAQIREAGPYGVIMEKCTDLDPRRRFRTVAALRSALFDVWRTASFSAPVGDDNAVLTLLLNQPDSAEAWRAFVRHLDVADHSSQDLLLRAINVDLITKIHAIDEVIFSQLLEHLCSWAAGHSFEWTYCDVVGDRLTAAYNISTTRLRCQIVLAALQLAIDHNRWHVMEQVGRMLDAGAEEGLVDRMLIEISIAPTIAKNLRIIEKIISWSRLRWHQKIRSLLDSQEPKPE